MCQISNFNERSNRTNIRNERKKCFATCWSENIKDSAINYKEEPGPYSLLDPHFAKKSLSSSTSNYKKIHLFIYQLIWEIEIILYYQVKETWGNIKINYLNTI